MVLITDTDKKDLSSDYWYKVRFPDGSELTSGPKSTTTDRWQAVVGPPNTGVAVTVHKGTKLDEDAQAYLIGKISTSDGKTERTLYLSLDEPASKLYWYESDDSYGIVLNQEDGRVGLFAKDKDGNTRGLRVIQHGDKFEVHVNKCEFPLECAFVRIKKCSS